MRTVPLDAKQVRKVADYLIREKEETYLQKSEESKRQYSVKRGSRYSIDLEKRSAAKREILDFLRNPETMAAHAEEIIDLGRFSPHVVTLLNERFGLKLNSDSTMKLRISELMHIAKHVELSPEQTAELVEVLDSPNDVGYSLGQDGNRLWFFRNNSDGGASFELSILGRRNIGWLKTFFNVDDKKKYIDSKGIHVETVAKSAEQSTDRPGANPAQSTWMPSENNITQSTENASGIAEKIESDGKNGKQYSVKRHNQVNPIRRPGDVRTQHQAIIDQPYEPKSNATLNLQARRRIVALGGFDGAIRTMLDGDFTVGSDVSERVLQLVLNSDEFARLNADSRAVISELYVKHFGTEIGRALAARRLGVLDLGDILSIQAHVNALMAKIGKEKPNSRLREEILDEFGIDIDNLPEEIVHTPRLLDEVIRRMLAGRASVFDKAYEFWINSILSAPTTHAANTLGNTANAVYELGDADPDKPTDPAEAVRFSFGRDLHFPRRRVY